MSTSLDYLKLTGTTIVTDTGEFEQISKFKPQDATTNPSLILAAAKKIEYSKLIDRAIDSAIENDKKSKKKGGLFGIGSKSKEESSGIDVDDVLDRLLVEFGNE